MTEASKWYVYYDLTEWLRFPPDGVYCEAFDTKDEAIIWAGTVKLAGTHIPIYLEKDYKRIYFDGRSPDPWPKSDTRSET